MQRTLLFLGLIVVAAIVVGVIVASQLTPQATNPAFTTAVDFVQAAAKDDEASAKALLDPTMQAYVTAHCPQGSASTCVESYTPSDWGNLVSAIFRRAAPDGKTWNVEVIANYEHGEGTSGVCSLIRVEPDGDSWRVAGWAGFVHCGDPGSRDMATNPDTPNRAP